MPDPPGGLWGRPAWWDELPRRLVERSAAERATHPLGDAL